jgi:hypothetical protein
VANLAPNFEMTMYLAQATGSCIITDNSFRWQEIRQAINRRTFSSGAILSTLAQGIEGASFAFPQNVVDIAALVATKTGTSLPALMRDVFKYLAKSTDRQPKPNWDAHLAARFRREHSEIQSAIRKARILVKEARISCSFPQVGIQDNSVNRLLLMSSSERHMSSVPMAFYIEGSVSR